MHYPLIFTHYLVSVMDVTLVVLVREVSAPEQTSINVQVDLIKLTEFPWSQSLRRTF